MYLGDVLPLGSVREFYREISIEVVQIPPAWYTVRSIIGCKRRITMGHEKNCTYVAFTLAQASLPNCSRRVWS